MQGAWRRCAAVRHLSAALLMHTKLKQHSAALTDILTDILTDTVDGLMQGAWRRCAAVRHHRAAIMKKNTVLIQATVRGWLLRKCGLLSSLQAHKFQRDLAALAIQVYPVFHVIPHSFFEPTSYRIGVKSCPELFFRKSPPPDFGNSSIVMTALRRNSGYFTLMR